jgi:hypothetical protein
MRDASIEDMAAFWVARLMEKADWTMNSEIYLAVIRHAATRYVQEVQQPHNQREHIAKLESEFKRLLAALPQSHEERSAPAVFDSWMVPAGVCLSQINPEMYKRRYANYWSTDVWKSDFLAALESQFWSYRDYAHGAEKGKMAFLRSLAEVWIAAATKALVRYAEDDKQTWRATAKMLRRQADMVEADGLRSLPWGNWG